MPEKTTDICLASDESCILATSNGSVITCYSAVDGVELGCIGLSKFNNKFYDLKRIILQKVDESTVLLLAQDYGYLLNISDESIVLKVAIYQCIGYNAEQSRIIVWNKETTELGSFPYYSLDDLIRKGNNIIGLDG